METPITADASTRRVRCPACGHTSRGQKAEGKDLRCKRCGNLHKVWRSEAGKQRGKELARHRRRATSAIPAFKAATRWTGAITAAFWSVVKRKGAR